MPQRALAKQQAQLGTTAQGRVGPLRAIMHKLAVPYLPFMRVLWSPAAPDAAAVIHQYPRKYINKEFAVIEFQERGLPHVHVCQHCGAERFVTSKLMQCCRGGALVLDRAMPDPLLKILGEPPGLSVRAAENDLFPASRVGLFDGP